MVTYIDYWNQFWKVAELVPIPSSEVALYAYLLNECNSKYWKMPFLCASSKICESIRISKETLCTAREHLACMGLISYTKGKSRYVPSKYCILDLTDKLTDDLTYIKNKDKEDNSKETASPSWSEIKDQLRNDESWLQGIVLYLEERGMTKNYKEVCQLLEAFFQYLELVYDTQKPIDEVRKHFLNWAPMQKHAPIKSASKNPPVGMVLTDSSTDKFTAMKERMKQ